MLVGATRLVFEQARIPRGYRIAEARHLARGRCIGVGLGRSAPLSVVRARVAVDRGAADDEQVSVAQMYRGVAEPVCRRVEGAVLLGVPVVPVADVLALGSPLRAVPGSCAQQQHVVGPGQVERVHHPLDLGARSPRPW